MGLRGKRFRFAMPDKVGPWRDTRGEALEDALAFGFAEHDEHIPERIYLIVPGDIETERNKSLRVNASERPAS